MDACTYVSPKISETLESNRVSPRGICHPSGFVGWRMGELGRSIWEENWWEKAWEKCGSVFFTAGMILLMEEFLHHLEWLKPYQEWDNHHPWWCRILSINSMTILQLGAGCDGLCDYLVFVGSREESSLRKNTYKNPNLAHVRFFPPQKRSTFHKIHQENIEKKIHPWKIQPEDSSFATGCSHRGLPTSKSADLIASSTSAM